MSLRVQQRNGTRLRYTRINEKKTTKQKENRNVLFISTHIACNLKRKIELNQTGSADGENLPMHRLKTETICVVKVNMTDKITSRFNSDSQLE